MKTLEYFDKKYPAKFEVCTRCNGEGTHVNPSIDGDGLTASDIDEAMHDDDQFLDNYFGGVYDVACEQCKGKRVDLVVDWEEMTEDQRAEYQSDLDEERSDYLMHQAELRAGC